MKTSKKIISIILALVLMTTMVTSAFYASACNKNNHDAYKEAGTVLDNIDQKLDAYNVDLVGLLNGKIDSKSLINTANGYINEKALNEILQKYVGQYLDNGQWLVDLGNGEVSKLLTKYLNTGVTDPLLQELIDKISSAIEDLPDVKELKEMLPSIAEIDKMIDDAVGEYINDGSKLISQLDKLVSDAIDGNLVYSSSGRKILKSVDGDLAAKLDAIIEKYAGEYLNDGSKVISLADQYIVKLLETQEINGVPIIKYLNVSTLDSVVNQLVLADNSSVLQSAANALKTMFPDIQPTYESIISCLVPILSAFDFGGIMSNISNPTALASSLQLASPSAFAYLAGVTSDKLDANYYTNVNASLTANGYTGDPVAPIITLTEAQKTKLLTYVDMEKGGQSLADIAAAGFNWKDFIGSTSALDIANAFIKIDLGDADKLGSIASAPGVGPALVNLLCDLLNDLKTAPVTTILKKLSDSKGLAAIADFAMSLLNGDDNTFKSYELFFTDKIYYDKDGNTTFYDKLDESGNPAYTGPKAMDQYLPVIAAALDFLSNISTVIDGNNGDLLKTLLVDKLPQLKSLIKSAISYTDSDGKTQPGIIAYLLDDYTKYLQAGNAVLSYNVLIGLANKSIDAAQATITDSNKKINIWKTYLTQVKPQSDAAKLAKAKELGILGASVTSYDEDTVNAGIEAKKVTTQAEIDALGTKITATNQKITTATTAAEDARKKSDDFNDWRDTFTTEGTFYDELTQLLTDQDASQLDGIRQDCKAEVDKMMGAGTFESLATYILDNMGDYDGDSVDDFIDAFMLSDGLNMYAFADTLDSAASAKEEELAVLKTELTTYTAQATAKAQLLADLESGAVLKKINAAGAAITMHISDTAINAEGDFSADDIQQAIDSITNEDIANAQTDIAASQAKIQEYTSAQSENQKYLDNYDISGLQLEQSACNDIVDALMEFIGGSKDMKSLYEYFSEGKIIEMLVATDRVQALKKVFDSFITLFGDKPNSSSDYKTNLWKIEDLLFGSDGILSTFYTDFCKDPVLAFATRLAPLGQVVDIVYDMGFLQDYIKQYKTLISDVTGLFGDDKDGFISLWKQAYTDKTASHHYTNAIISLLPGIVSIYDDLLEIPQVAEAVAPYTDAVNFVLNLLSKNFYNDVMNDGFVETILSDDNLDQLHSIIDNIVVKLDNGEKIKKTVDLVFTNVLDGLYHDILTNPVTAVTKRINSIADLVTQICSEFNVDISAYQYIITDIKNIFDSNFTDDWLASKTSALINRVPAVMKLIDDISSDQNILKLINDNVPEDYKALVQNGLTLLKSLTSSINKIASGLVADYNKDPLTAITNRVPTIVDMLTAVTGNTELINEIFAIDAIKNISISDGLTVGDLETIIKRACKDFTDGVAPELKKVLSTATLNIYAKDKLSGLLVLAGGAGNIISNLAKDSTLINEIFDLDVVKNIQLTDDMKLGDISGLIKTVIAMLPDILSNIDLADLLANFEAAPTKTIIDLCKVVVKAIKQLMASKDPTVQTYVDKFKNTLTLVKDILSSVSLNGNRIVVSFLSGKTPIDDVLSPVNIKRIKGAAKEITSFIGDPDITKLVNSVTGLLDGLLEKVKKQPLLTTVEDLGDGLRSIVANARNIDSLADLIAPYDGVIDAALNVLDNIGKDAKKSLVGAVLTRVDGIKTLVNELFGIEAFASIDVLGYKLSDFRSLINLVFNTLGGNFYDLYKSNPLKAIFSKIDNIKAIYAEIKSLGILDKLNVNLNLYGYNILTIVDYVLPIIDKDFYGDFEQSLIYALVAKNRLGRLEEALKNIIWYADLFSYSVNCGLCSLISGVCGVLDGLYEDLELSTTPANGGNVKNSTARAIVSRLPQIQALLESLKPLLGTDGKLINLTDLVSDTVKMEKGDILKAIAGVDMIKPYYYGISDVLDVFGENAAKYDWNTIPGIINAINGVGTKIVPTLKKALDVTDVKWNNLEVPKCNYSPSGTPESYLVELSGQLGEGVLTPLVSTLLKAALTIPAIKDIVGEDVGPNEIAGLLNDLLEFDFKNDEVEFDAFNTEHLIYTVVNLVLPKTSNANSPATSDEIVMIVIAAGTAAAASAGIFISLKKRKRETADVK